MKKLIFFIVINCFCFLTYSQNNFCDGWTKGYQKGLESCFKAGVTPVCLGGPPTATSYQDGYGLGYAKAREKCKNNQKNTSSSNTSAYTPPKPNTGAYTPPKSNTGAYANPKYIQEDYTSFSKGVSDGFNSVAGSLHKIGAANEAEFKKIPLKSFDKENNLNRYKYIFMKEDEKYSRIFIKNYSKNKSKLPAFIDERFFNWSDEIKQKPQSVLYAFVKSTMGFSTTYVNLQLYDMNDTQIYSGTGYASFPGGAIKAIFKNLVNNGYVEYKYDESLELLPNPKLIMQQEINKKASINDKNAAIEELKKLKELLDLELITQDEFNKKAVSLKKIILEDNYPD